MSNFHYQSTPRSVPFLVKLKYLVANMRVLAFLLPLALAIHFFWIPFYYSFLGEEIHLAYYGLFLLFFTFLPIYGILDAFRDGWRKIQLLRDGELVTGELIHKTPLNQTFEEVDSEISYPLYSLTFRYWKNHKSYVTNVTTHQPEVLEDEAMEFLLINPRNPAYATGVDDLPGGVEVDSDGELKLKRPLTIFASLILPLVATVFAFYPAYSLRGDFARFQKLGKGLQAIEKKLAGSEKKKQIEALIHLEELAPALGKNEGHPLFRDVVKGQVKKLSRSEKEEVKIQALRTVGKLAIYHHRLSLWAVEILKGHLKDDSKKVRIALMEVLKDMEKDGPETLGTILKEELHYSSVDELLPRLKDPNPIVRKEVLKEVSPKNPRIDELLPRLKEVVAKDPSQDVRLAALNLIIDIPGAQPLYKKEIMTFLKDLSQRDSTTVGKMASHFVQIVDGKKKSVKKGR